MFYATFESSEEQMDEWGNYTGEFKQNYSLPTEMKANISPAKGSTSVEMFGDALNYSKSVITADMDCPIDEHSILWVDNLDTTQPHDYVVVRVAKSLNYIAYAIKKVDLDEV